jgi:hypothetical protein
MYHPNSFARSAALRCRDLVLAEPHCRRLRGYRGKDRHPAPPTATADQPTGRRRCSSQMSLSKVNAMVDDGVIPRKGLATAVRRVGHSAQKVEESLKRA